MKAINLFHDFKISETLFADLASMYASQRQFEKVLENVELGLLFSHDCWFLVYLGVLANYRLGKYQEGIDLYWKNRNKLNELGLYPRIEMLKCLVEMNKLDSAKSELGQIRLLKFDEDTKSCLLYIEAKIAFKDGRFERCIDLCDQIMLSGRVFSDWDVDYLKDEAMVANLKKEQLGKLKRAS